MKTKIEVLKSLIGVKLSIEIFVDSGVIDISKHTYGDSIITDVGDDIFEVRHVGKDNEVHYFCLDKLREIKIKT